MSVFRCADRIVVQICRIVLFALFVAIIFAAFTQVFCRFVLNMPLTWTDEMCRFGMVWITFIGAGYAVRTHAHIVVDLLVQLIPQKPRAAIERFNYVFIIIFSAVLTYFGANLALVNVSQFSPGLHLSMGLVYFVMPIGGVLMIVYAVAHLLGWKVPGSSADMQVETE